MESQLTKEKNESWRQFNFQNEYGIVVWFGQVWIAACQWLIVPQSTTLVFS